MNTDATSAFSLRHEIALAQERLKNLQSQLHLAETACHPHKWEETRYTPIYHKGYQTQGDPPGTMGVDWQGPVYVPPFTEKIWSRTCEHCGKTQTTKHTKKEQMPGIIAGTSGQVEMPDFGNL